MSIYTDFKPTYLYIKQHSVTGKLYFGKTTKNPEKYHGSGKYWKRHITEYGLEYVETLWYCLFYDEESIIEFATTCSILWGIVESEDWANLIYENGIDGGTKLYGKRNGAFGKPGYWKGIPKTEHSKRLMSLAKIGKPKSDNHRKMISLSQFGKVHKLSICPHCGKTGGYRSMTRYHFNNCKMLSTI